MGLMDIQQFQPIPGGISVTAPSSGASSQQNDLDVMGLINSLKTDSERYNDVAKKVAEAGKPNTKGRLLGAGALVLLSLLGGKKGMSGMGEALTGFNNAFSLADKERQADALASVKPQMDSLSDESKMRRDVIKELVMAQAKPLFEAQAKDRYPSASATDHRSTTEKEYDRAVKGGYTGSFLDFIDRNRPDKDPRTTEQKNFEAAQKDPNFAKWVKDNHGDPYVRAAAEIVATDLKMLRASTDEKIQATLRAAEQLKNRDASAPGGGGGAPGKGAPAPFK